MTIELFNEFLMKATSPDDWSNEDIHPQVWGRHSEENDGWEEVLTAPDPYELVGAFVAVGMHENTEAMLVMYGRASQIDKETEEPINDERVRVRIMVYLADEHPKIAMQLQGQTVSLNDDDDLGCGPMADAINWAINAYKKVFSE